MKVIHIKLGKFELRLNVASFPSSLRSFISVAVWAFLSWWVTAPPVAGAVLPLWRLLLLRSTDSRAQGLPWLQRVGSAAAVPRLSQPTADTPRVRINPCALHWQVNSSPLGHQRSPFPPSWMSWSWKSDGMGALWELGLFIRTFSRKLDGFS